MRDKSKLKLLAYFVLAALVLWPACFALAGDGPGPLSQAIRQELTRLGILNSDGEYGGGGSGDVTGAASSTDNAIARMDGTGGKTIQNSDATLDDNEILDVTSSGKLRLGDAQIVRSAAETLAAQNSGGSRTVFEASNFYAYSGGTPTLPTVRLGQGEVGFYNPSSVDGALGIPGARGQSVLLYSTYTTTAALSGASVTVSGARPAGALILGVTIRVTTAITGATSFDIGDGSDVDRYGDNIAVTLNTVTTRASSTADPTTLFQAAAGDVVLTAVGSNFTGGVVRVCVHYVQLLAPQN